MVLSLVDCRLSEKCRIALRDYGFFVIPLPSFPILEESIQSHPDTLMCKIGDKLFAHEKYREIAEKEFSLIKNHRSELELIFTDEEMRRDYPHDILFNCARVGKNLFGRLEFLSLFVRKEAESLGYKLNNVRQGYSACSTLVIDEKSIITSDVSIFRAATGEGIDALLIESGSISLPLHDYGFIGGASAVYGENVFFFGNIATHPNAKEIRAFIEERHKRVVCLSDEGLSDFGSAIFI